MIKRRLKLVLIIHQIETINKFFQLKAIAYKMRPIPLTESKRLNICLTFQVDNHFTTHVP